MKNSLLTNLQRRPVRPALARLLGLAAACLAGPAAAWGQEYSSLPITYTAPGGSSGGTALTNALPANSTNAVMSDPIGLTKYDSCAIQWEFNALSNAAPLGCTN